MKCYCHLAQLFVTVSILVQSSSKDPLYYRGISLLSYVGNVDPGTLNVRVVSYNVKKAMMLLCMKMSKWV